MSVKKMLSKSVKGVFFDLYGTLLVLNDTGKSWKDWAKTYYGLIKNKAGLSFDDFSRSCNGMFSHKAARDPSGDLTTYETRLRNHLAGLSVTVSRAELRKIADETPRAWQKCISLASDAIPTLKKLKETRKLALISNFDHTPHLHYTLKQFGLDGFFDPVIVSDEAGCAKPGKRIFDMALEKTDLKAHEAVYVGDNPVDDVEGAKRAGMTPILIVRGTYTAANDYSHSGDYRKPAPLPDVQTISELKELLIRAC